MEARASTARFPAHRSGMAEAEAEGATEAEPQERHRTEEARVHQVRELHRPVLRIPEAEAEAVETRA